MEKKIVNLNLAKRYLATQHSDAQKQSVATDGYKSNSVL